MGDNAKDGAQWFPSAFPLWELHLCRNPKCSKPWLKRKTSTKLSPQNTIGKVLKFKCLRCHHIVHLDLKCMSYNKEKGSRVKLIIWLLTTSPFKIGIKWSLIGHAMHLWKNLFEGYKILHLHVPKLFDLRKIWVFKVLGQQKSQFWASQKKCHLDVAPKESYRIY
jgi:hypothetical protein